MSATAKVTTTMGTNSTQSTNHEKYETFGGRDSTVSVIAESNILRDFAGREVTAITKYYLDESNVCRLNPNWVQTDANQAAWVASTGDAPITQKASEAQATGFFADLLSEIKNNKILIFIFAVLLLAFFLL